MNSGRKRLPRRYGSFKIPCSAVGADACARTGRPTPLPPAADRSCWGGRARHGPRCRVTRDTTGDRGPRRGMELVSRRSRPQRALPRLRRSVLWRVGGCGVDRRSPVLRGAGSAVLDYPCRPGNSRQPFSSLTAPIPSQPGPPRRFLCSPRRFSCRARLSCKAATAR